MLYVIIPKIIYFLQLGIYSVYSEQTFRNHYTTEFNWLDFNINLVLLYLAGKRKVIALDPSFIKKSVKKTPYISWFWSGCDNRAMRVLEILVVGVLDADDKDCIYLYLSRRVKRSSRFQSTLWQMLGLLNQRL